MEEIALGYEMTSGNDTDRNGLEMSNMSSEHTVKSVRQDLHACEDSLHTNALDDHNHQLSEPSKLVCNELQEREKSQEFLVLSDGIPVISNYGNCLNDNIDDQSTSDEIDFNVDDALDEGCMEMECTLERGFSLQDSFPSQTDREQLYEKMRFEYEYKKSLFERYKPSLAHFIPIRSKKCEPEEMPVDKSGMINYTMFSWMTKFMWQAYKHGLTQNDIPLCSKYDMCWYNTQRLERLWNEEKELHGESASLQRASWKFVKTRVYFSLILYAATLLLSFLAPTIFMRYLIDWLDKPDGTVATGLCWAAGLLITEFLRILTFGLVWAVNYRTGVRLRAACLGLVYKKIMMLPNLGDKSVGEMINLFANDGQRIFDFAVLGVLIIGGPIVGVGGVAYILWLLGPYALCGMIAFLLFYPVQYLISRLTGVLRRRTVRVTDERVQLMSELFACIKLIKMYAWEDNFHDEVLKVRDRERVLLEKSAYVQSLSLALGPAVPVIAAIVTFVSHTAAGLNLTPAQATAVMGLIGLIHFGMDCISFCVVYIKDGQVSMARLQAYSVWTMLRSFGFTLIIVPHSLRSFIEYLTSCQRVQALSAMAFFLQFLRTTLHMALHVVRSMVEGVDSFERLQALTVLAFLGRVIRVGLSHTRMSVHALTEAFVTFVRLQNVLDLPVQQNYVTEPPFHLAVRLVNASFAWPTYSRKGKHRKSGVLSPAEQMLLGTSSNHGTPVLHDLCIEIKKGELVGVCGSVGTGKSSLLHALLGQLALLNGGTKNSDAAADNVAIVGVAGTMAYVGQQAWILNATVRENILMGENFDPLRYYRVVYACSLTQDLDNLPAGDLTEIGERGVTLSGGQKQRLSLARALYSNRNIYLLDDPLSAVDAEVGTHIFKWAIKIGLKQATVVLVTHQLQYLPQCSRVLLLQQGRIVEHGTHAELLTLGAEYAALYTSHLNSIVARDAKAARESANISRRSETSCMPWRKRTISCTSGGSAVYNGSLPLSSVIDQDLEDCAGSDSDIACQLTTYEADFAEPGDDCLFNGRHTENMIFNVEVADCVMVEDNTLKDSVGVQNSVKGVADKSITTEIPEAELSGKSLLSNELPSSGVKNEQKLTKLQKSLGALVSEERAQSGNVPSETYACYVRGAGGFLVAAGVILSFGISIGSTAFSSWWLSHWLSVASVNISVFSTSSNLVITNFTREANITDNNSTEFYISNTSNISFSSQLPFTSKSNETVVEYIRSVSAHPDVVWYQSVYASTVLVILAASLIKGAVFMKASIRASTWFHDHIMKAVMKCPMSFFDCTPIGRVLNVFSRDMDEVDVRLPMCMEMFLSNVWMIGCSLVLVCLVFWQFLPMLVVLAGIFMVIRNIFRIGIRDLKRLENVSRSPLYSHVSTSLGGLSTIHAYGKQQLFISKFLRLFDESSAAFYLYNCAMRWLAIRLDILAMIVVACTSVLTIILRGVVEAAFAGLALAYASQLSGIFQFTVRLSTETEAHFISVERIHSYIKHLPSESGLTEVPSPALWPQHGRICFRGVAMRYRPNTPLIFNDLSFDIHEREKIGVVGRTGSGKSSLVTCLFRLVELEAGVIRIDGTDISKISLQELRSKLSIIPQDPVMFSGTIRYNLDPSGRHSDQEMWAALERVQLKQCVTSLPGQLSARVTANGDNLSVGERQLMCMARALLRNTKIVVLDEATANIDTESDSMIQRTLKFAFEDCTLISIAHRVNTILWCDRVMVLSDGKLVQFDAPTNLLQMSPEKSLFAKMVAVAEADGDCVP